MPLRTITVGGDTWDVAPAGGSPSPTAMNSRSCSRAARPRARHREVRVTRYSPQGARVREASFAELSGAELQRLFAQSQSSVRSPEAGYAR